jgi:ABC-type bacteriocin/lantibiotic exporter with double-glycine peptidase domain
LLASAHFLTRIDFPISAGDYRSDPESQKIWRTAECCGINSLYIALRLCRPHKEISYDEIENRLPHDKPGNSLAEMCACAESFGVKAKVLKLLPEMLTADLLPAIVHFEEEKDQLGHFVVVTAVGEDRVEYIDGTSAILQVVPMSDFRREWSGYTIVFVKQSDWQPLYEAAMVLGVFSIGLTLWNRHRRHSARMIPASLHAVGSEELKRE